MNTKTFAELLEEVGEFGVVEQVMQTIALANGLPGAKINELLLFESGQMGTVFLIDKDKIEILVLSNEPLKPGVRVTRLNKPVSVPVGPELYGKIIDPLGNPLSASQVYNRPKEERFIDTPPPSMAERKPINEPMLTGVAIIDMMIPLGKGQRELVIGDRKTGKTQFLLAALKSQIQHGAIGIYAAIGRKKAEIKLVNDFLKKEGILDKAIIVATTSSDSPSLIYQTPYSAMAIAEYLNTTGKDVLVVMDDLSSHARFYREISLLAKRFPGRDAYPGDIFYTHARLLERAGKYKSDHGDVSITCLPICEIVEGDFAGYIATNLMGMTDGHIFFDQNVYYKGRRPAVNLPLSVTRVGRQAQTKLMRNINRELTTFLSGYEKMLSLSQFGAELTKETKAMLKKGDNFYKMFEQPIGMVVPLEVQIVLFALIWLALIDDPTKLTQYRANLMKVYIDNKPPKLFSDIIAIEKVKELTDMVEKNKDELCKIAGIDLSTPTPAAPVVAPVAPVAAQAVG